MSTKHTPGPWVKMNSADVFSELGADSGDGVKADDNDGWLIADCANGYAYVGGIHTELGYDVQVANARLIAAAPELLEALLEVLEDISGRVELHSLTRFHVSAAIRKALGEEV